MKTNVRTGLNLLALVGVLGAGVVSLNWVRWHANAVYHNAANGLPIIEAKLKAEGFSLDPKSLDRKIPDKQNAATYYASALRLCDVQELEHYYRRTPGHQLPKQLLSSLHSLLAKNGKVLALLHAATAKPECDLHINYANPRQGMDKLEGLSDLARLLAVKAMVDGYENHVGLMNEDFSQLATMAKHANQQRCVAALYSCERIKSFALNAMHRLVSQTEGNPAVLATLAKCDKECGFPDDVAGALGGELVIANERLAGMRFSKIDEIGMELDKIGDKALLRDALRARVLEKFEQLLSIAKQPPVSLVEEVRSMSGVDDSPTDDPTYLACKGIGQKGVRAIGSFQLNHARRMVLLLGMNILLQKEKSGAFPKTLALNVPEPFGGESFRYERTAKGFWVHCDLDDLTGTGVTDLVFLYPYHNLGGGAPPFRPY